MLPAMPSRPGIQPLYPGVLLSRTCLLVVSGFGHLKQIGSQVYNSPSLRPTVNAVAVEDKRLLPPDSKGPCKPIHNAVNHRSHVSLDLAVRCLLIENYRTGPQFGLPYRQISEPLVPSDECRQCLEASQLDFQDNRTVDVENVKGLGALNNEEIPKRRQ